MNGTAHIGNGDVINKSVIGIQDGKLVLVANALVVKYDPTKFDTVIDISGKHVYPGIIGTNNTIGLTEIEAVRSTIDSDETGQFNPNVRTLISYNTDSRVIPTVRTNGVLLVQVTPRGGTLSGTSSVMTTSGWNWEDAVVKTDDGVHLNWPLYYRPNENTAPAAPGTTIQTAYQKQCEEIKTFFTQAKAYCELKDPVEKDLRFESMRSILAGTTNLYFHANYAKEIIDAVNFCRDFSIKKPVLVGGYDAWRLTDMLKENNVSVMLFRSHSLPLREDDDIDMPFKSASLLQQAGVLYCIQNEGDQEATGLRNLPFQAGTCVAYGLTSEQALQAVTISPAKILGIDKEYGTLEPGKNATLFVSNGDALDMRTNKVTIILVNGAFISTDNHQEALYRKFSEKYSNGK
ncbi:MAG: amidohydrolase family protein [Flavobacteriales bacterium]